MATINKVPCVYMLANRKYGTLYIGVTSDLVKRVWEHKQHLIDGFTKKYNVTKLVYVEQYTNIMEAIVREKQLKKYPRLEKIKLIELENPYWQDLYFSIIS